MISKTRYFFGKYNDDPLRHDEIVTGIGRHPRLSNVIKTFANVLTKKTREAQAFRRFLEEFPIPIYTSPTITSIKITSENRKLIQLHFTPPLTNITNDIDKGDFNVIVDNTPIIINNITVVDGLLYIYINQFILDGQNINVHYIKDPTNLLENLKHFSQYSTDYDWDTAKVIPPDTHTYLVQDFDNTVDNLIDTISPVFSSITLNNKTQIQININEPIFNNNNVSSADFIIKLNNVIQSISNIYIYSSNILINLDTELTAGTLLFTYDNTLVDSNLSDSDGNIIQNIYDLKIQNNIVSYPLKSTYDNFFSRIDILFNSNLQNNIDLCGNDFFIERYINDFNIYSEIDNVTNVTVDNQKLLLTTKFGISNNIRIRYENNNIPTNRLLANYENILIKPFILNVDERPLFNTYNIVNPHVIKLTTNLPYINYNINQFNFILKINDVIQDISSIDFNVQELLINLTSPIIPGYTITLSYLNNMVIYFIDINIDKIDLSYNTPNEILNSSLTDLSGNRFLNVFDQTIINDLITIPLTASYDNNNNYIVVLFDSDLKLNTDLSGNDFHIEQFDNITQTFIDIDYITHIEIDSNTLKLFVQFAISHDIRLRYNIDGLPTQRLLSNNLDVFIESFSINVYEPIQFNTYELINSKEIKITTNKTIVNNNIQSSNFQIYINELFADISTIDIIDNSILIFLINDVIAGQSILLSYTNKLVIYYVTLNHDKKDISYNLNDQITHNNLSDISGGIIENVFNINIENNLPTIILTAHFLNNQLIATFTDELKQNNDICGNDFIILKTGYDANLIQPGNTILFNNFLWFVHSKTYNPLTSLFFLTLGLLRNVITGEIITGSPLSDIPLIILYSYDTVVNTVTNLTINATQIIMDLGDTLLINTKLKYIKNEPPNEARQIQNLNNIPIEAFLIDIN